MVGRLANPLIFVQLAKRVTPWLYAMSGLLFAIGLVLALGRSPPDYQQGEAVRIIYVHVPAAWMSLFVYMFMAAASAAAFVFRHPLADLAAKAAAPVGLLFTVLALLTGSLWGRPMWGTYWVWDARLTSMAILLFLYIGYVVLWSAIEEPTRAARAARILALIGALNIPIIHFSVEWWNTLHQGATVFRRDGPAMPLSMLVPLLTMVCAYNVIFFAILLTRMQSEVYLRRLRAMRLGTEALA